jgi:hypothetical protein
MGNLLTIDVEMIVLQTINLLLFAALAVIIKMELLREIKDITLDGRTLLLHAKRMLPEYISTILWPFTIECYQD